MTVCKTGEAAAQASEPLLPTTSRSVASSSSSSLRSLQAESPPSYDSCTTSAGPVMYELETSWPVSDTVASGKAAGALGGTREETLDIIVCLFPQLAAVDRSRINLALPGSMVSSFTTRPDPIDPTVSSTANEFTWDQPPLTDRDWPALAQRPSPPAKVEVSVRDEWPVALFKLAFLLAVGLVVLGTIMVLATVYLDDRFRTPCRQRPFGC